MTTVTSHIYLQMKQTEKGPEKNPLITSAKIFNVENKNLYLYTCMLEIKQHIPPFMYLMALWASDVVSYSTVIRWYTTLPDDFSAVTISMQFIFP